MGKTKVEHLSEDARYGGIAQLGERLLCKQEVNGSIPFISTTGRARFCPAEKRSEGKRLREAGESKEAPEEGREAEGRQKRAFKRK